MEGARHVRTVSSNVWFKGAFILTMAALLIKVMSAVYRVPFQNIVGDTGFYIYQQVYPFYGVVVTLSTYGFPVVISKLYMEMKVEGNQTSIEKLVGSFFFLLFSVSIIAFLVLFSTANTLAEAMKDPQLSLLLRVISFGILLSPLIATLRGVFQGDGNMVPTAVSQVGEQTVRVGTILFVAFLFTTTDISLYIVGAGALFGSITGGITALLILLYFLKKSKSSFRLFRIPDLSLKETRTLLRKIFFEGITISISAMLLILLQLADSLNLYSLLLENGIKEETAKVMKGVYDRGQPLIQIGTIISTSMALSIVPLITSNKLKDNKQELIKNIRLSLVVSYFIGLGATVGLIGIIEQTNSMLFENTDGSDVLAMLCFIIVLNALIVTMIAILQGLGHALFPAILIVIGFVIKYWLNKMFVSTYGVNGAAISSLIVLIIIVLFLYAKLRSVLRQGIFDYNQVMVITIAGIFMFIVLKGYMPFSSKILAFIDNNRIKNTIQALTGVLIGGLIYVFIVLRGNTFKAEELYVLPFGEKLTWFLRKKRREKE